MNKIAALCGDDLLVQITTEAAGRYGTKSQFDVIYEIRPQAASLAVREFARASQHDITKLDRWMRDHNVLPQWIVYDMDDLNLYRDWVRDGGLSGAAYPVLFVLGAYDPPTDATAEMLPPFLAYREAISHWMVCAFGPNESAILEEAAKKGGHIRVGFENNLCRPPDMGGGPAADNAELVAAAVAAARRHGREPATPRQTRQLLTPQWR